MTRAGRIGAGVAAGIFALFLFYQWSYWKGYRAADAKHAEASARAEALQAERNSSAVGRELSEATHRAEAEERGRNAIRRSNHAQDDDRAAPVVQHTLDRLRMDQPESQAD